MGKFPTGHAVTSRCDNYLYLLQWFFSKTDKTFSNLICQSKNTDPIQQVPKCSKGLNFLNLLLTQFLKEECIHAVTFSKNQHGASEDT